MLSPFFKPGPGPAPQPPLLWAVLAWVQREIQRSFFNRTPDAVADTVTTSEDTGKVIDALANDTDAEGDAISVTSFTQPANGTVVRNADGTFTYTPRANYNGPDSFTYTVRDNGFNLLGGAGAHRHRHGSRSPSRAVNDAPIALNDSKSTVEDTAVSGNVLNNDVDIDGNTLTAALATGPASGGTVSVAGNGAYTYTPGSNFVGTDTFTYTVSDGTLTDTATVTITVTAVNDAPVAGNDFATTAADTAVTIAVLGNDTDIENSPLTPSLIAGPEHGTLALNTDKTYTYTPIAGYDGSDSFTYKVNDGALDSNTATVPITVQIAPAVAEQNIPPTAVPIVGDPDPATGQVTGALNAFDADGHTMTFTLTDPPDSGAVTPGTGAGFLNNFVYTPTTAARQAAATTPGQDFDTFTITIDDNHGGTLAVPITVQIAPAVAEQNIPPTAVPIVGDPDPATGQVTGALNAFDADGHTMTFTLTDPPDSGAVTPGTGAGFLSNFVYTPTTAARQAAATTPGQDFDTFTITIDDNHGGTLAVPITVQIAPAVAEQNIPPTAVPIVGDPDPATGQVTGALNAFDADGHTMTFTLTDPPDSGAVTPGTGAGFLSNFVYTPTTAARQAAATTPGQDFDTFTITIDDNHGGTLAVPITVQIAPAVAEQNIPPTAVPIVGDPDPATGQVTGALNAFDADGHTMTFTLTDPPDSGAVTPGTGAGFLSNFVYTPTTAARQAAATTPGQDFDTFTITIDDNHGGTLAVPITVQIAPAVAEQNIPPTAVPIVGDPDPATGQVTGALNAFDADGHTMTFTLTDPPDSGAVTPGTGAGFLSNFVYTPTTAARQAAATTPGQDFDTFTITIDDNHGGTLAVPITVQIAPAVRRIPTRSRSTMPTGWPRAAFSVSAPDSWATTPTPTATR